MTCIEPMLKVLLEEMVSNPTRKNVLPKYCIVLQKINEILNGIKKCSNNAQAEPFFKQLLEIQVFLSQLVYREKIDEYPSINKFVSDFDRIDDLWQKNYMFEQIKK